MKKLFYLLAVLCSTVSCLSSSKEDLFLPLREDPVQQDFIGTWEIIEPTYKKLEEFFGVEFDRAATLTFFDVNTFEIRNAPQVFGFTVIDETKTFDLNGEYHFYKNGRGYHYVIIEAKTNDIVKYGGTNMLIKQRERDSSLLISHMRIDDEYIVFKKVLE